MLPVAGSKMRKSKYSIVVLPNPEGPTIAFVLPGSIFKLRFSKRNSSLPSMKVELAEAAGCPKETPLKSIWPFLYSKS
jgi:hypothetical protein